MSKDPFIRLDSVAKSWTIGTEKYSVLNEVSMEVFFGESISIVGPSGSGKSTLLHILGLLTPVDKGTLYFDNQKLSNAKQWRQKRMDTATGFIFQDAKLIANLNVIENVAIPLLHRGLFPKYQKEMAVSALDRVGLSHRLKHRPHQLSGGELMRVAIARALVLEPQLILADEPTGTLDSKNGDIVAKLLFDLVSQTTALVMVTHHLPLAKRADKVFKIHDGSLTQEVNA